MKITIETHQLTLGMFVHALKGSWFSSPFWRRRFLISESGDIEAIHKAGIDRVTIDTAKGTGIPEPAAKSPANRGEPRMNCQPSGVLQSITAGGDVPLTERDQARAVIARSKAMMRRVFERVAHGAAVNTSDIDTVVEDVAEAMLRNQKALTGLLRLRSKDEYTYVHSVAVCALMIGLGRQIGLGEAQVRELGMAGLLHDIGKLAIPAAILNKPTKLTEAEFAQVMTHPERGVAIIRRGGGIPAVAIEVCHHHHEKFDGTGYPAKISGTAISLAARMGAICDVYDALTSDRSYKSAWSPLAAVATMHRSHGQFDPDLLFSFFQALSLWPAGLMARTHSGLLGVVLPPKPRETLARLRLFYDVIGARMIRPRDITLSSVGGEHAIAAQESPVIWGVPHWEKFADYLFALGEQADLPTLRQLWQPSPAVLIVNPVAKGMPVRPWQVSNIARH